MPEYPVQLGKVQAPPLREETLARDRLLEWLSVKIHRRVVLLIAEAGYGKTTLLADFSRRTRIRVLWFRLDRGDRDWVGFIAHLVAAVRIHVPDFGQATGSLLRETATASPSLDTVLDTFLRELGGVPNEPTALVLDDFHLVDDSVDVRHVLRELLTRGPERLTYVFASRREPPLRLARLRALGEVAELGTDQLRFDAEETERLFRDTYAMRLEPGVLAELRRRTEGWAASLQLVRAAIHDRDPSQVRAFISSLSGAEGHLYEYLAEEVIGELPIELQEFLMRTSVLDTVDLALGPVAAAATIDETRALIDEGERHGLFGRGDARVRHVARAHPLVRDFLQDRLRRSVGEHGVRDINLRVAQAAERVDWRTAGRHYLAAGDEDNARRVLSAAIENILATGAYAAAQELAASLTSGGLEGAPGLILESRLAQQRGAVEEGRALAEEALAADPDSTAVLLNLVAARSLAGDVAGALDAGRLLERTRTEFAALGRAYQLALESSVGGSLTDAARALHEVGESLRNRGQDHFLGVSLCNEAQVRMAMGEVEQALACADEAIALLSGSSAGVELVSARLVRASAIAHHGDIEAARAEIELALQSAPPGQRLEVAVEAAVTEEFYGDPTRALEHLTSVSARIGADTDNGEHALLARAVALAEVGNDRAAGADLARITADYPHSAPAFELRRRLGLGLVEVLAGGDGTEVQAAAGLANRQGARVFAEYGALVLATANATDPSSAVVGLGAADPVVLSMAAEAVVRRIADLSDEALGQVRAEALRRPWRWAPTVRRFIQEAGSGQMRAASLLEDIGDLSDVPFLRSLGRRYRDPLSSRLGHALARRLAPKVVIEDLGRVQVEIGGRNVDGAGIRRKVLALLCLLLTRTDWTATREEVVDALWPELDPQSALNSLNQTVYFLRRVFEPEYREELSPGYVQQDGETIWLDPELIDARSRRCLTIIRGIVGDPATDVSLTLAKEYRGRFALDFAYEDWASSFRDALHAAYLRVIETAIRLDVDAGYYVRGVLLAERANEVEPDSEELQLALARIYSLSGAHAAAAEQYTHYSKTMKDLGVEPRPLSEV